MLSLTWHYSKCQLTIISQTVCLDILINLAFFLTNAPAVWVQMSWPHWSSASVSCCFEKSAVLMDCFRLFAYHPLIFVRPNHNVLLVTESCIFSHDSGLHYLFWTLDLWFDILLPNSQPISPILLNQYVRGRMFALTDCGWQKSTQTFAGCPFNNPFVYRGWSDGAGLGDTIPISITGELS